MISDDDLNKNLTAWFDDEVVKMRTDMASGDGPFRFLLNTAYFKIYVTSLGYPPDDIDLADVFWECVFNRPSQLEGVKWLMTEAVKFSVSVTSKHLPLEGVQFYAVTFYVRIPDKRDAALFKLFHR